jgi:hypothetical protein
MRFSLASLCCLLLTLSACGSDLSGPGPAELEELCGEKEPVRILALDAEHPPQTVRGGQAVGERFLFAVNYDDGSPFHTEIWSTDRCGEEPFLLDSYDDGYFAPIELGGSWYVCHRAENRLVALDPTGVASATPVFETRGCDHVSSNAGILVVPGEGEIGPLVFQPWPADPFAGPAEQIVLHDAVVVPRNPYNYSGNDNWDTLAVVGGDVLAITADDELIAIDLVDAGVRSLASGVRMFAAGERWMVWQGIEITGGTPDSPEGPLFLLEHETEASVQIAETSLMYSMTSAHPLVLESLGLLHYRDGFGNAATSHYLELATLGSSSVGGYLQPTRVIDDSRALFSSSDGPPYVVIDFVGMGTRTIWEESGVSYGNADGLIAVRGHELLRISYWGYVETLAHSVEGWYQITEDDRIITPVAVNDESVGQLVVVEPETLEQSTIAPKALSHSIHVNEDGGELLVSYLDPDPERFGIWLAKLPSE